MTISRTVTYALGASAFVAILIGCSSSGSYSPGPPSGHLPNLAEGGLAKAVHLSRKQPWMAPDAKKNNLLYISDVGSDEVYVFSYRAGRLVGALTGFNLPEGECVDKNGNVWITDLEASKVVEYAHGGTTPINIINEPNQFPLACAVDPKTGSLAVANSNTVNGSGKEYPGPVLIYKHAVQGKPKEYLVTTMLRSFFLGYDNNSNLFADGQDGAFDFAELAKGGKKFKAMTISGATIGFPGAVQWDGKHLALGDQSDSVIYQLSISGSIGTVVGSTPLTHAKDVVQFWIQGPIVIGPDAGNRDVEFFKYPSGGSPTKTIAGFSLTQPVGAVVSMATK